VRKSYLPFFSSGLWVPPLLKLFEYNFSELLVMHPPPSPKQTCPTSDTEGLGCGCIKLNEAAALERMPGNLWGFHWGDPSGTWFSRW
jgi:hypothetical protein